MSSTLRSITSVGIWKSDFSIICAKEIYCICYAFLRCNARVLLYFQSYECRNFSATTYIYK